MKDCDLQSWFENRWGGEQRKQPDHWPLAEGASCTQRPETWAHHRGRSRQRRGGGGHCDEVEVVGVGGAVAGRAAGKVRWRGEGELSRGKVIGLGEGARVVRTEGKQGRWGGGGGGVPYWWSGGEGSVGSEVRGGGKNWGSDSERKEKVLCRD